MPDMRETDLSSLFQRSHERVRATKNILSSLLWVLGITAPSCTALLIFGSGFVPLFGAAILTILLIYIGGAFGYFAVKAPDRLQSEEHRENMTLLAKPYQDSRGVVLEATEAKVGPPNFAETQALPTNSMPQDRPQ